jgi:hypothetical protein
VEASSRRSTSCGPPRNENGRSSLVATSSGSTSSSIRPKSIELLDEAQRLAAELDVTELLFIVTWTAGSNGKVFPPKQMNTVENVKAYLRSRPIFPKAWVKYG